MDFMVGGGNRFLDGAFLLLGLRFELVPERRDRLLQLSNIALRFVQHVSCVSDSFDFFHYSVHASFIAANLYCDRKCSLDIEEEGVVT
jgi:hypothetical protein